MLEIEWGGEHLQLYVERAIYWPKERTLFLADLHVGKAATFRAWGIPIPDATTGDDLARLTRLIELLNPQRIVVLGDLIHHKRGRSKETLNQFQLWRAGHASIEILFVQGNHDRFAGDPPEAWRIAMHRGAIPIGPFHCVHEPSGRPRPHTLCGHLHPSVTLRDPQCEMRVPCFLFGREQAILPAFTHFSGTAPVRPNPSDRIFLIGPEDVIEYKHLTLR